MMLDTEAYNELLKDGKLEEAELLRQSYVPNRLIKFFWLDDNEQQNEKKLLTLKKNELWIANKNTLNDPYEYKGVLIDINKMKELGYSDVDIETYKELLNFDDIGITCFSANDISYLPMWAYYTNNHKGFCAEYEIVNKDCIHEVSYEDSIIKIASLIKQSELEARKCIIAKQEPSVRLHVLLKMIMFSMLIKNSSWSHEKEFRVLYNIGQKEGCRVPVSSLGLKTNRIIAGINCSKDNIKKLDDISNELGLGNVYVCDLKEDLYGAQIKSVCEE